MRRLTKAKRLPTAAWAARRGLTRVDHAMAQRLWLIGASVLLGWVRDADALVHVGERTARIDAHGENDTVLQPVENAFAHRPRERPYGASEADGAFNLALRKLIGTRPGPRPVNRYVAALDFDGPFYARTLDVDLHDVHLGRNVRLAFARVRQDPRLSIALDARLEGNPRYAEGLDAVEALLLRELADRVPKLRRARGR